MAGEWPTVEFGSILVNSTRNGVYKSKEFHGSGVKIVNMGELFACPRLFDVRMKRVELTKVELEKSSLETGDLLFARRSLVAEGAGKCSIVMEIAEPTTFESSIIRARPDPTKANSLFLYYFFGSQEGRNLLGTILRQVAVSGITGSDLVRLRFPVPPLGVQKAIAHILGTLDDKIESNRRMSETLQAMARAIFRAWFVDFEPVKAKAAGARSFPGMPQDVFKTLSARLIESEMGPTPEGWQVASIGDSVSVRGGGTPSTKVAEYWQGGTHCWLTPKDLSGTKDPILLSTDRMITDKGLEKISSGLLPVGSVLLSSRAPVGYLVISGVPTAINQGFIAMVCDGPLPPLFVYHWTQSVMDEIKSRASGTTFPEISKTAFRPIKVCVPTEAILESFTATVEPLFDKLAANMRESRCLETIRDYLLPKLLSGDLRVVDTVATTGNEEAENA